MNATGRAGTFALLLALAAAAQPRFYTYVGDIGTDRVLLAWGTTTGSGANTIGRDSKSHGPAVVTLNGDHRVTGRNWIEVSGLEPDTSYPYRVTINGREAGKGTVRTHPASAQRLDFFVIGDYGNGSAGQHELARVMVREYARLKAADRPVRFVLTVGDNIYARTFLGIPLPAGTGRYDRDWRDKHFIPYEPILREVPFYMTLGNHDGKESELAADLPVQLDNFFFPGNRPSRYYSFNFGNLIDFFALDTTRNTDEGLGPQTAWLAAEMSRSRAPWKVVYGHHPPFNAGPRHGGDLTRLQPIVDLLARHRVAAYFCGHEHNFQVSERDTVMAPTVMFLTGAGGELRAGDARRSMRKAQIAAWAPVRHFLHVEIEGATMRITPRAAQPVVPVNADGQPVDLPFVLPKP